MERRAACARKKKDAAPFDKAVFWDNVGDRSNPPRVTAQFRDLIVASGIVRRLAESKGLGKTMVEPGMGQGQVASTCAGRKVRCG